MHEKRDENFLTMASEASSYEVTSPIRYWTDEREHIGAVCFDWMRVSNMNEHSVVRIIKTHLRPNSHHRSPLSRAVWAEFHPSPSHRSRPKF
jgi:hypothetical protein